MVYRGKPSTGCKKCRQRKIKCDERAIGCVKCADRGLVCPGYDNPLDRMFQDESERVKTKVITSKQKAMALREMQDLRDRNRRSIVKVQDSIGVPLLCPLIDVGISFFMSHYALGLDQPPMRSDAYHRHLSTQGFHPLIATSMTALGLAGISNIFSDFRFQREALRWYSKALQMTNTALASSKEIATSDNTLLTTMLLSKFEAMNNEVTLAGWSNHVDGSASLLRMRGIDQFSTPAGRRMYMQTVGLVTMLCMAKGEELPNYVRKLNNESIKYESPDDPGDRFFHLHIDVINLRSQILKGKLSNPQSIIERALELDAIAAGTFDGLSPDWGYEEIRPDSEIPGVFKNYYHIYSHMSAAQIWNWVRCSRIYLHDIIRNSLLSGFSQSPPIFVDPKYMCQLQKSTQMLQQLQADILASVPQHLHDTPKNSNEFYVNLDLPTPSAQPSPSPTESQPPSSLDPRKHLWSNFSTQTSTLTRKEFSIAAESKDQLPIIRVSGGYSSLWAVYIAGAMQTATPDSQQYVQKCLHRIATEFGINQGKVLAGALQLKMNMGASRGQQFQVVPEYMPLVGDHVRDWSDDWINESIGMTSLNQSPEQGFIEVLQ